MATEEELAAVEVVYEDGLGPEDATVPHTHPELDEEVHDHELTGPLVYDYTSTYYGPYTKEEFEVVWAKQHEADLAMVEESLHQVEEQKKKVTAIAEKFGLSPEEARLIFGVEITKGGSDG